MTENLAEFLAALRATRFAGEPDQSLIDATNKYAQGNDSDQIPPEILDGLKTLPISGASWLAILLGSSVEGGSDPMETGPAMWDAFCHRLEAFPETVEGDDFELPELTESQTEMLEVFPSFCQGLVAHLSRMPAFVKRISQNKEIRNRIEFLESYSYGCTWVNEILLRQTGTLLLLHTDSRRGWMMDYENTSNCFHLFSLIQNVAGGVIPGAPSERDPNLIEASTGGAFCEDGDTAWWHYGDPTSHEPNIAASIFGEMNVVSIPEVDGQKVILLWPSILKSRGWDAGFFGPSIESSKPNSKIVSELSEDEASVWFAKLKI